MIDARQFLQAGDYLDTLTVCDRDGRTFSVQARVPPSRLVQRYGVVCGLLAQLAGARALALEPWLIQAAFAADPDATWAHLAGLYDLVGQCLAGSEADAARQILLSDLDALAAGLGEPLYGLAIADALYVGACQATVNHKKKHGIPVPDSHDPEGVLAALAACYGSPGASATSGTASTPATTASRARTSKASASGRSIKSPKRTSGARRKRP